MITLGDLKSGKSGEDFSCESCDFKCSRKCDFDRHCSTDKHKRMTNHPDLDDGKSGENNLSCECGKQYKYKQCLWKHKKTCEHIKKLPGNSEPTMKDLIGYLMKENVDLKNEIKNIMIEVVKNSASNTNIQNMTNNNNIQQITNNKSFNLNFFLNETCKNAMNIDQFIDTIKLEVADFMHIGEVGFVQGVSDIILKFLNSLDVTLRPIHCADKKREVFYVKDGDKWEKEDVKRSKLVKIIRKVMDKNCRMMPKFREKHPDCIYAKSIWSDSYSKMVYEAMGGKGDDNNEKFDKIIRNIAKEVTIDKSET